MISQLTSISQCYDVNIYLKEYQFLAKPRYDIGLMLNDRVYDE